jgi:hypothetical protein
MHSNSHYIVLVDINSVFRQLRKRLLEIGLVISAGLLNANFPRTTRASANACDLIAAVEGESCGSLVDIARESVSYQQRFSEDYSTDSLILTITRGKHISSQCITTALWRSIIEAWLIFRYYELSQVTNAQPFGDWSVFVFMWKGDKRSLLWRIL